MSKFLFDLKYDFKYLLKRAFLVYITILGTSCQHTRKQCIQFKEEVYVSQNVETKEINEQHNYIDYLHGRFDNYVLDTNVSESYQITFYSSHSYGKTINLNRKENTFFLSTKNIHKKKMTNYTPNYSVKITQKEWDKFIGIIHEYNFWTEETKSKRKNELILDGSTFLIEGYRNAAKSCNKRYKHYILTSDPIYDKAASMAELMFRYGEILYRKYNGI